MTYKCDTCAKRTRKSTGIYIRCRFMGDIKKQVECSSYDDGKKPVTKVGFLDAIEMGVIQCQPSQN